MDDYFAVFGLPRKLGIDAAELQRRFYELSRRHHPDFHQGASPAEQDAALERSALVNRAYRALRDEVGRVEYLLALEEGRDGREGSVVKPVAPRDLLEEMLDVQEALEEAKADGLSPAARARLAEERDRLRDRRAREEAALVARGVDWDAAVDGEGDRSALLGWFRERLATRAYLRTVIDDLTDALGEEPARDVAHRRH
jgi:molecular chaperone HscB